MFRALRVKDTGQWAGPLIEDGAFPDNGSAWAENVATTLGLPAGSLEVVDGENDPRTGDLLLEPEPDVIPAEPPPPSPLEALVSALTTAADFDAFKNAVTSDQGALGGIASRVQP